MSAYCIIPDLRSVGLRAGLITDDLDTEGNPIPGTLTTAEVNQMITNRSAVADGFLGGIFRLPLVSWGADLRMMICKQVAYDVMVALGFSPEDATGTLWAIQKREADDWFLAVAKRAAHPVSVVDSSSPPETSTGWEISSEPLRGW